MRLKLKIWKMMDKIKAFLQLGHTQRERNHDHVMWEYNANPKEKDHIKLITCNSGGRDAWRGSMIASIQEPSSRSLILSSILEIAFSISSCENICFFRTHRSALILKERSQHTGIKNNETKTNRTD